MQLDGHAVEIEQLAKTYATRNGMVEALRNVDLMVADGEFVSIVGPSGCGKSTLLHMVAGLLPCEQGSVRVAGSPATSGRREVGIMLQRPVLFPWRNVLQNVVVPAEIFKLDSAVTKRRAMQLLELVGLAGFENKYPWELSGGMQQRVSLVRTLIFEPRILLMDEPFAALDEFTRERLTIELSDLHESLGMTVLYVTHNIQEAAMLSDRIVTMTPHPGRIVDVVDDRLPRPRTGEMLETQSLTELVAHVRHTLFDTNGSKEGMAHA